MSYEIKAEIDGKEYTFESDVPNPSEQDIMSAIGGYHQATLDSHTPSVQDVAQQIEPGVYGDTVPAGQKILNNLQSLGGGYAAGELGAGLVGGIATGVSKGGRILQSIRDFLNRGTTAETAVADAQKAFGTLETPSSVGFAAKQGLNEEMAANTAMKDSLYAKVPDVSIPTPNISSTAQEVLQSQGRLPASIQNEAIIKRASDLLNMGSPGYAKAPTFQVLNQIRSDLGDLATNGKGLERLYAAKLKGAVDADIQAFSQSGATGSQGFSETFARAKGFYGGLKDLQNSAVVQKISNVAPENIPDAIFKAGRTQDVLAAKAAMGQQGFNVAKQAFFNDLLQAKDTGKVLTKYAENNSDFLKTVFNAKELSVLQKIDQLKKAAASAQKTIQAAKVAVPTAVGASGITAFLMRKAAGG